MALHLASGQRWGSTSEVCGWPFAETLSTIDYDDLGRKINMSDADMGAWQYAYNAAGELIRQIDPRGSCTVNAYDLRGRLYRRQDYPTAACAGTPEQQADFLFDTVKLGRLGSESVPGYQRSFTYDSFGRPNITTTAIGSSSYTEQTTYDQFGRVFQQFDATGRGVLTEYTSRGFVKRLRDAQPGRQEWVGNNPNGAITLAGSWGEIYYEVRTMDMREQVTEDWRGVVSDSETDVSISGLVAARQYRGDTGWLTGIQAGDSTGSATRLQHLSYEHDLVGNLHMRHDVARNVQEVFGYDLLNRLLTVDRSSNNNTATEAYQYDAWGNLMQKAGLSGIGYQSRGISCAYTPGPHAISQATIEGAAKQYCYDQAGQQIATWAGAVKEREILYTAAGQVKEIRSWAGAHNTKFFYGPGRSRYQREDRDNATATGPVTTTHYVGAVEIIKKSANNWEKKRYIGGVLIQTLGSDGGGSNEYLFTDHLGSTDVIAHRFGNVRQQMSFDAFGARRNLSAVTPPWVTLPIAQQRGFDTNHTTHGYTGHEGADKVGLIHMNGRMYDPVLGRFIQADSIVQDPFDPQSLNRYAYVLNNPLSATDPSGNISFGTVLKLGISVAISAYLGPIGGQLILAGEIGSGIAVIAISGAAAGAASGGPKGAVRGAFTALVFFGAGQASSAIGGAAFGAQTGLGRAAFHGLAGGTLESLTGGNFGHGFATAGLGKAISSRLPETGSDYSQGALAALVGGTVSEASGGNFANGALTGAMQFAFNQLQQKSAFKIKLALKVGKFVNIALDQNGNPSIQLRPGESIGVSVDGDGVGVLDLGSQGKLQFKTSPDEFLELEKYTKGIKIETFNGSFSVNDKGMVDFTIGVSTKRLTGLLGRVLPDRFARKFSADSGFQIGVTLDPVSAVSAIPAVQGILPGTFPNGRQGINNAAIRREQEVCGVDGC